MSFSVTATVVGIAAGAVSIGSAAYALSGAGNPSMPSAAASSKKVSDVQAQYLPYQRGMTAAAQQGSKYTFTPPKGWTNNALNTWLGTPVPFTKNKDGSVTLDFTGFGAADTQAILAHQSAAANLDLAQKYDPQFIQAALEQQQLANPQGGAARLKEDELIQHLIQREPDNTVANELQGQVQDQMAAGKGLDAFDQETLNQAVAQALSDRSGGTGQGQDWAGTLTTGAGGEARRMAGIQKGMSLLSSGTTAGDVAYRREQQNLANLSNENSGQTPTSQFHSMSAAQTGPTPVANSPALPLIQNNLAQGAQGAAQQYSNAMAQPNPWMAGMSTAITGLNGVSNALQRN